MWPELCACRFVTSPVTQIEPTCFSSNRLTCAVNSETDKTLRVASAGNSSPKSHCDLDLLIEISLFKLLKNFAVVASTCRTACLMFFDKAGNPLTNFFGLREILIRPEAF